MHHPPSFDDGRPPYDAAKAASLLGKIVLVGVTVEDKRGELRRQEQYFGRVTDVDPRHGITIALMGAREGETKNLTPHPDVFEAASPGTYRLRPTGETIVDPAYTCTWTLVQPDS